MRGSFCRRAGRLAVVALAATVLAMGVAIGAGAAASPTLAAVQTGNPASARTESTWDDAHPGPDSTWDDAHPGPGDSS